ncbi:alpha/beta fold hydrolase [Halomarina pelagica]|uniref:alpha/beta fold hydrolase n=1 Tax=Halomarina pelagica TaxID=2961599 RepID=UPI0020C37CF1|nr:alpha/beta hydrolase [Halomarina sp. BND7]
MSVIRTNDIETYYERRGDGPPIVFIHGAIVDHSQWTPQLETLSDEYTTVAYDVRGHGRTGGSTTDPYSIELFVEDLEALITALDLDHPVLCGLSMGGCIAQVYAARHSEQLAGLVLADTFTPEVLDWRERLQFLMLKATIPPVRLVGYERVEKVMVWFQERLQGEGVSGDYEKIEQLRAEGPKMATDEFAKVIHALTSFHETDIDFSAIAVPTLVLYGEHDAGFIRRHAPKLGADLPNATVRAVPDSGHTSNLDNPECFTIALQNFLAEISF